MQLSTTHKILFKYTAYVIGVVGYLAIIQMLLVENSISSQYLVLLLIPLIILAYLFNTNASTLEAPIEELLWDEILSKRENEVAQCAAQGKVNKRIAEELFISENTVKTHIKSILSKLNLKNRTQIAHWYYQKDHHPKG